MKVGNSFQLIKTHKKRYIRRKEYYSEQSKKEEIVLSFVKIFLRMELLKVQANSFSKAIQYMLT